MAIPADAAAVAEELLTECCLKVLVEGLRMIRLQIILLGVGQVKTMKKTIKCYIECSKSFRKMYSFKNEKNFFTSIVGIN